MKYTQYLQAIIALQAFLLSQKTEERFLSLCWMIIAVYFAINFFFFLIVRYLAKKQVSKQTISFTQDELPEHLREKMKEIDEYIRKKYDNND